MGKRVKGICALKCTEEFYMRVKDVIDTISPDAREGYNTMERDIIKNIYDEILLIDMYLTKLKYINDYVNGTIRDSKEVIDGLEDEMIERLDMIKKVTHIEI